MGMTRVSNFKARAALLVVGLLATLLVLALTACGSRGSAQEGGKARPLPNGEKALSPGEYHSVKFKPPLSFEVGKGWIYSGGELPDFIEVGQSGGFITFANVKKVLKPGTYDVVDAPKDLVGWFQHHPYLKTSKPQPVTLGGIKGEQFDASVDHLPKDYYGNCGTECLDIFYQSGGERIGEFKEANRERRVFVLEEVKGETVVIWFAAPPDVFDKFAPKAQKVVESVKWTGS